MPSFLYLLGLGFLVISVGSCTISNNPAAPLYGHLHMLAWVLCWVGGGIIERLPAPPLSRAMAWLLEKEHRPRPTPLPASLTTSDIADMQRLGIEWRDARFWFAGTAYERFSDAANRAREALR